MKSNCGRHRATPMEDGRHRLRLKPGGKQILGNSRSRWSSAPFFRRKATRARLRTYWGFIGGCCTKRCEGTGFTSASLERSFVGLPFDCPQSTCLSWISVYSQRMRGGHSSRAEARVRGGSRRAMTAIGVFLFFGAIMALLAGTTLIWQGTFLDQMWAVNAAAYKQLAPFGRTVGILF